MQKYHVQVPVFIDFASAYDTHDSGFGFGVQYQATTTIDGINVSVHVKEDEGTLELTDVEADSENDAVKYAVKLFTLTANLVSLEIQLANQNSHYGHARLGWRPRQIKVTPSDHWIRDSVDSKIIQTIDGGLFGPRMARVKNDDDLEFILSAATASFLSVDYRTKFFNAFSIFEFVEARYSKSISAEPLLDASTVATIESFARSSVSSKGGNVADRVASTTKGALSRMTVENRATKLARILSDIFEIKHVTYGAKDVSVDVDMARSFIEFRNRAFHGGKIETERHVASREMKETCDLAILVVASVVQKLIDAVVSTVSGTA